MSKMFQVQPPSSALYPGDKAQTVSVTFRSDKEVELKDLAALKCQVGGVELLYNNSVAATSVRNRHTLLVV